MLNAKLERHLARPHAFSHEISAYIYLYVCVCVCVCVYVYIDDYSFITPNH